MRKEEAISDFVFTRPNAVGVYGYGSGVFKQEGYDENSKPQIDLIFVVEDLKEWHLRNMQISEGDYSFMGRLVVNHSSIEKLKGRNRITYYSNIYQDGYKFKYGVIEEKDFLSMLENWESFFIAGRFHKPVLEIKSNSRLLEAIEKNKKQALLVASLLSPNVTSKKELLRGICSLSYLGALRMQVAENPRKIDNIVEGCFDKLNSMYDFNVDYITEEDNCIMINHTAALRHLRELPICLLAYLYYGRYQLTNIDSVRRGIFDYLREHNKAEEISQVIDSIKTNGIVRSAPYLAAKVKKRILKR